MRRAARLATAAGLATAMAAPVLSEVRATCPTRPLTDRWRRMRVAPREATRLGLTFRPLQAEALGLDPREALDELLVHPYEVIRLGAYWNRIETTPGRYRTDDLDRQVDAAEAAGKQIVLCLGPVKTFGYPEFFVPDHLLPTPFPEGRLVEPADHRRVLDAAAAFLTHLVDRYKSRDAVTMWQVEHEAVDPLGMEHSWRLSTPFVRTEVAAVRAADPTRPVMLNGFLPSSLPVAAQQWWRTRDQGDSLDVARRLGDVVGIDFYPRHALVSLGGRTTYLDGSRRPWQQRRRRRLIAWAERHRRQLVVCEGQAEPWETSTVPPDLRGRAMFSCLPEHVIDNYNHCMRWNAETPSGLSAYLFWGAEYWLARKRSGDPSYLEAFRRVLEES